MVAVGVERLVLRNGMGGRASSDAFATPDCSPASTSATAPGNEIQTYVAARSHLARVGSAAAGRLDQP